MQHILSLSMLPRMVFRALADIYRRTRQTESEASGEGQGCPIPSGSIQEFTAKSPVEYCASNTANIGNPPHGTRDTDDISNSDEVVRINMIRVVPSKEAKEVVQKEQEPRFDNSRAAPYQTGAEHGRSSRSGTEEDSNGSNDDVKKYRRRYEMVDRTDDTDESATELRLGSSREKLRKASARHYPTLKRHIRIFYVKYSSVKVFYTCILNTTSSTNTCILCFKYFIQSIFTTQKKCHLNAFHNVFLSLPLYLSSSLSPSLPSLPLSPLSLFLSLSLSLSLLLSLSFSFPRVTTSWRRIKN